MLRNQTHLVQQIQVQLDFFTGRRHDDHLVAGLRPLADLSGVEVSQLPRTHVKGEAFFRFPLHRLGKLIFGQMRQPDALDA